IHASLKEIEASVGNVKDTIEELEEILVEQDNDFDEEEEDDEFSSSISKEILPAIPKLISINNLCLLIIQKSTKIIQDSRDVENSEKISLLISRITKEIDELVSSIHFNASSEDLLNSLNILSNSTLQLYDLLN